jgi:hypothetical protein
VLGERLQLSQWADTKFSNRMRQFSVVLSEVLPSLKMGAGLEPWWGGRSQQES